MRLMGLSDDSSDHDDSSNQRIRRRGKSSLELTNSPTHPHLEYDGTTIVPRRGIQRSARSDKPHSHPRAYARLSVDSPYPKARKKPNPSVGKGRLRLSSGEGNEYGIPD